MKKVILGLIFSLAIYGNVSGATFTVDADLNSISPIFYQNVSPPYSVAPLDTGLFLKQGDLLEILSSGIWSNAPVSYNLIFGPDGNPNENIALTYLGAGYPVAALMGRIGNNNYFFVGSNYSNHVSESGIFYLGFNDTDYGNNWGTVKAGIKISSIPEPASLILFGLSILGAGMTVIKEQKSLTFHNF